MNLVKIIDLTNELGISSRSLRYYEQVGLIQSVRPEFEKYRYYDTKNIERLKQIMVLRKMQIPIKDIIHIYESEDMSTVVEVFVKRINEIDDEVSALSQLKRIVGDFLQVMLQNGITKISALPLLYEEMDKQLDSIAKNQLPAYKELNEISEKLTVPADISIIDLPGMRMLSSKYKDTGSSDPEGFWNWMSKKGIIMGLPGRHEMFEYQNSSGQTVMIQKAGSDFVNDGPFEDYYFNGGLFAVSSIYVDEDMEAFYRNLIKSFDKNPYYEVDYVHGGGMRHESLAEPVLSPDEKREKISLFLPVKRRLPDPVLYDPNEQIEDISVREIEEANPVLWSEDVAMDRLIPILDPYYHINEHGEAEYIAYIDKRLLSTDIQVKLPFRVDIEFRVDHEGYRYGYGSTEGSMRFYHGRDLRFMYGVNMDNNPDERLSQQAVCFNQPIFGDFFRYPQIGRINQNEYNRLTWIVGEKHFAVILNDEVRYCGIHFPYMTADLHLEPAYPIIIGSNGQAKIFLKAICVSQLKQRPKIKMKEGVLAMITKQSNNILPNIHPVVTLHYGENYWFNGCAKYVMECLGEPDYDYWFFAGMTGDNFVQNYALNGGFYGDGVVDVKLSSGSVVPHEYFEQIFETCGYASTFVYGKELRKNTEMYVQTLIAYIDKGVPVILYSFGTLPVGVFVGYEEHGKVLLYMAGDKTEPRRMTIEEAIGNENIDPFGWIFIGEKKEQKDLKQIYRNVIMDLPGLLTTKTDTYCFGAEAFRAWAAEIENGRFDGMKPEEFDSWCMYTTYVCGLATNSGGCRGFLNKAQELNPDFTFLEEVRQQYRITGLLWNRHHEEGDKFAEEYARLNGGIPDNLEDIGGGFNITLEALQNIDKRSKIAATIRKFGDCMDEVVRILTENLGIGSINS